MDSFEWLCVLNGVLGILGRKGEEKRELVGVTGHGGLDAGRRFAVLESTGKKL